MHIQSNRCMWGNHYLLSALLGMRHCIHFWKVFHFGVRCLTNAQTEPIVSQILVLQMHRKCNILGKVSSHLQQAFLSNWRNKNVTVSTVFYCGSPLSSFLLFCSGLVKENLGVIFVRESKCQSVSESLEPQLERTYCGVLQGKYVIRNIAAASLFPGLSCWLVNRPEHSAKTNYPCHFFTNETTKDTKHETEIVVTKVQWIHLIFCWGNVYDWDISDRLKWSLKSNQETIKTQAAGYMTFPTRLRNLLWLVVTVH